MQLLRHSNIFVAGDAASVPEEKLAQNAEKHAEVVVKNILRLERGGKRPLCSYRSSARPVLISLGKLDGILIYAGWTLTGFIPAVMKEVVEWKVMVRTKSI